MQPRLPSEVGYAGKNLLKAQAIKMYSFKKEERLCSQKLLDKLFHSRSSFLLYPFRVVWLREPLLVPAQVVISVPKRKFKRAVDRNILKRRIREAYRLNKGNILYPFLKESNCQILLSLTYVGKEIEEFEFIEKRLKAALVRLTEACNE